MKLDVKLFARAKDIAGTGHVQLDVPDSAKVRDLRSALAEQFPDMSPLIPRLLIAIGTDYADDQVSLHPGANVACFPPVSGG